MKGYFDSNTKILYIFPQTADTIPYVAPTAEGIAIQQENIAEWKEANEDYAGIMFTYNYLLISVQKKVWSDHTDEDITLPYHDITVSAGSSLIDVAETAQYTSTVTITPKAGYTVENVNIASPDVEITVGADSWTFTMPDKDVTLAASEDEHTITISSGNEYVTLDKAAAYAGQTVTITPVSPYTVSALNVTSSDVVISAGADSWTFTMIDDDVTLSAAEDDHTITLTGDTAYVSLSSVEAYAGQTVTVTPVTAGDFSNITLTSSDAVITTGADSWTFTMPDNNVTINVAYAGQHDYSQDYFTIRSLSNNNDVSFTTASGVTGELSYSLDDGSTWNTYANAITLDSNEKVLFKGELVLGASGVGTFTATSDHVVEGNIMSLLKGDNFVGETDLTGYNNAFSQLFNNNIELTSAENLVLPATTLADWCYQSMFQGCTSLTSAPELSATTLVEGCYEGMLQGCTSLTTAPELPATTLASYCYSRMFQNCTSLTTAPELPATTLASYCYQYMFYGCTSLTTAPELPATTLDNGCYYYMFYNCTSLNYIKCLATDIEDPSCTLGWVDFVASTGTFVKDASMSDWTTGNDGIPSGWTVEDAPL